MPIAVGLDIGSEAVRAAVVDTGSAPPVLRRFAEVPLPAGAVLTGDIIDESAVGEALGALFKRHHLPRRRVVAGIAGRRVFVRRVDVPHREGEDLAEALPRLVEDSLPLPVEDVVLDYLPLEQSIAPAGAPLLSILVVAAERGMLESLAGVARRAGVRLMSIDLQAFGLVRAAFGAGPTEESQGNQGLLDIGATLTQIAVVRGGVTRFVHIIPAGGSRFTEALAAGASLSPEEAEERKRSVGVAPGGMPGGDDEPAVLCRLLTREADRFIEEVGSPVRDYLAQAGERSLQRLVVSGNGARLPHLASRIARALGTRVEPARVLDHVSVGRIHKTEPQLLALQPVLPAAVGLALWGSFVAPRVAGFGRSVGGRS